MDSEKLAALSLKIAEYDKALRFILVYLEGLKAYQDIDIEEELFKIAQIDRRFVKGSCKEIISLKTDQFNSNGNIYIGKNKVVEIKDKGYTGILYIY